MFPSLKVYGVAAAVGLVPLLWELSQSGAETTTSTLPTQPTATQPTATQPTATEAHEAALECRAARVALEAELARLRQSCDVALRELEACRAGRPEWGEVGLFSCGFEMSTSLTRGDVDDPASIEDCGGSSEQGLRSNCPVPDCEAELERLEETSAAHSC